MYSGMIKIAAPSASRAEPERRLFCVSFSSIIDKLSTTLMNFEIMFSNENIGSLCEVGGVAAATYSLFQAQRHHHDAVQKSREQHREAINLTKDQHKKNLAESKRHYLLELFNNLEQHFQQLNADLIASSKESERDMFDQRNQYFQTIILASSVMFSALSTAIVNGTIPHESSRFFVICYAATTSLSFAFLFLCVVICIEIVLRGSSFMYHRAKNHSKSFRDAIQMTKDMMDRLRSQKQSKEDFAEQSRQRERDTDRETRSLIVSMGEKELNEKWLTHEIEIQDYMEHREHIHETCAAIAHFDHTAKNDINPEKKSFEQFWEESCQHWAKLAVLFFYGGTLNLLLSIMIFMWTQFSLHYECVIAALVSVSLISLFLIVGICTSIVLQMISWKTKKDNKSSVVADDV
jgi:hypothetical protein